MTIAPERSGSIPAAIAVAIVHDLRNPLSAIHGCAEMLIDSRLSQPQVQRIAQNLHGASVRMLELLEEFLERCRGTEKVRESCDLRELVTDATDVIGHAAEVQSVRILRDIPAEIQIVVDRLRVRRVLVNLMVNALEAMLDGGTLHISAVSEPNAVLIEVRDTGPGIAPEIQSLLFQPFVTAGKAGGIGLGLATSRQAILDHGGTMWAESSERGACFVFRLPRTVADAHCRLLTPPEQGRVEPVAR
ncbi:MAG: HAMP domain-containing histidine kinase [Acidobacteriia bacterium]|nr:HAMP domain-containing histidine kinase [Terriglobia bacterium]